MRKGRILEILHVYQMATVKESRTEFRRKQTAVRMSPGGDKKVLSDINNEINNVYEYCLAAGLSHEEIIQKASPLLRPLQKEEWKKRIMMLMKVAICCLAISYTLSYDSVSRSVLSKGRHILFKLLPLWDWTELYSEECLVNNPMYIEEKVYETDCQTCEDVLQMDYINTTSPEEVNQLYIQRNIPVIVQDATFDWRVMKESFTISNLTMEYSLLKEDVCLFKSNLRVKDHKELLLRLQKENIQKWYAHWENCHKTLQKGLRTLYSQPYFIPSIVQMTESNWVFMSSGHLGKKLKDVEIPAHITLMWIAQLRGYNSIRLEPKEPCDKTCNLLEDIIQEGEIILFSPVVWSLSYLPGEETENLAIAVGGFSNLS